MNETTSRDDEQFPLRILLVDDNTDNLRVLYETLEDEGFDLRVASSGPAALEVAASTSLDLVLLDIAMPEMDGYEVCRRLKENQAFESTAIIFLSAFDDTQAKVRGLKLGAVDFVTKPFQAEEILARVRTHLKVKQLQDQLSRRNRELEAAYHRLEAANKKMKEDLDAAAKVQQSLLPTTMPDFLKASFAWEYVPCDELAGDFLNVLLLSDKHVAVYVADVSGHGVASSLLSVTIARMLTPQASVSSLLVRPTPEQDSFVVAPADVAEELNRRFPMEEQNGLYFTILYGVLDLDSLEFRYVSAGQDPLIRVPQTGAASFLSGDGSPVGWFEDSEYEEQSVQLSIGDRIYLYSDGVPEAKNEQDVQFGMSRLLETIVSKAHGTLDESVAALVQAVDQWSTGPPQDDISILGVQVGDAGR